MRVGPALRSNLDQVEPYKLTYEQLYVPDTYTVFVRSNARAYLSIYLYLLISGSVVTNVVPFQKHLFFIDLDESYFRGAFFTIRNENLTPSVFKYMAFRTFKNRGGTS
jgi:hypothetical protein